MLLTTTNTLAFLGPIGMPEMIILGLLGVLIFGKRLPEVGKSLGKGIVEFKKGLQGIDDDAEATAQKSKQLDPPQTQQTETISTEAKSETPAPPHSA